MTCREVRKLLPELIDDALDRERRASLDEHIDVCSDCARLLQQLDDSLALFVAHQPEVEAPDMARLWRRVRSEALTPTDGRSRLWSSVLIPGLATVTAIVTLAVVFWPAPRDAGTTDFRIASLSHDSGPRVRNASEPAPPLALDEPSEASQPAASTTDAYFRGEPPVVARAPAVEHHAAMPHLDTRRPGPGPTATDVLSSVASSTPSTDDADSLLPEICDAPDESPELHDYALVVAEWTVREYDSVVTFAESDDDSGDADAEPVRTNMYAIVPSSYAVRSTEYVYDAAAQPPETVYTETSPAEELTPEPGTDTTDAGPVIGSSVHAL